MTGSAAPEARVVDVALAGGDGYPVVVGSGALARLPGLLDDRAGAHRYVIVADARVASLHGARVRGLVERTGRQVSLVTFPPGEASKSREQWAALSDALFHEAVGRDGCVVALGGGVTGDLAGFVAATYMRGIPVVQLPTSLVAMIDASVGGKTGIDVPSGKNLVGAFHPPRFVLADPVLAETLPEAERCQGLAEAAKHGALVDATYLASLEAEAVALRSGERNATGRAVLRSVEIKAEIVGQDEREGGIRQILNFGHTLGHALELVSDYALPHGSAVARGMVLEARLGESLGITAPGTGDRLARVLAALGHEAGRPTQVERAHPPEAFVEATRLDKKARQGAVRYVLVAEPGRVARGTGPSGAEGWSHQIAPGPVVAVLSRALDGVGV